MFALKYLMIVIFSQFRLFLNITFSGSVNILMTWNFRNFFIGPRGKCWFNFKAIEVQVQGSIKGFPGGSKGCYQLVLSFDRGPDITLFKLQSTSYGI